MCTPTAKSATSTMNTMNTMNTNNTNSTMNANNTNNTMSADESEHTIKIRCRVRKSSRAIDPEFGPCRETMVSLVDGDCGIGGSGGGGSGKSTLGGRGSINGINGINGINRKRTETNASLLLTPVIAPPFTPLSSMSMRSRAVSPMRPPHPPLRHHSFGGPVNHSSLSSHASHAHSHHSHSAPPSTPSTAGALTEEAIKELEGANTKDTKDNQSSQGNQGSQGRVGVKAGVNLNERLKAAESDGADTNGGAEGADGADGITQVQQAEQCGECGEGQHEQQEPIEEELGEMGEFVCNPRRCSLPENTQTPTNSNNPLTPQAMARTGSAVSMVSAVSAVSGVSESAVSEPAFSRASSRGSAYSRRSSSNSRGNGCNGRSSSRSRSRSRPKIPLQRLRSISGASAFADANRSSNLSESTRSCPASHTLQMRGKSCSLGTEMDVYGNDAADAESLGNGMNGAGAGAGAGGNGATNPADALSEPFLIPLKDIISVDQDVPSSPRSRSATGSDFLSSAASDTPSSAHGTGTSSEVGSTTSSNTPHQSRQSSSPSPPPPPSGVIPSFANCKKGRITLYRIFLHTSTHGYVEFSFENPNSHDVLLAFLSAHLRPDQIPHKTHANSGKAESDFGSEGSMHTIHLGGAMQTMVLTPSQMKNIPGLEDAAQDPSEDRKCKTDSNTPNKHRSPMNNYPHHKLNSSQSFSTQPDIEKLQANAIRQRLQQESTPMEKLKESMAGWISGLCSLVDCAACCQDTTLPGGAVAPVNVENGGVGGVGGVGITGDANYSVGGKHMKGMKHVVGSTGMCRSRSSSSTNGRRKNSMNERLKRNGVGSLSLDERDQSKEEISSSVTPKLSFERSVESPSR